MNEIGRSARSIWVIFKQELSIFFVSPIVYLIGAIWLFFAGVFFSLSLNRVNSGFAEPAMADTLAPMFFLTLFIAPALTMRLISEEVRTGTHELLLTAPVRDWEIVFSKWLATLAVFLVFMLVTAAFPYIMIVRGNPEIPRILSGYLGLFLLAASALAIGIFASALTQYQLVSFMVGMGLLLTFWLADLGSQLITSAGELNVFRELSIIYHYQNLVQRALINPLDIAYFVGLVFIFLFLATQVLSTRRWSS